MNPKSERTIGDLVRNRVNLHGELHLDKQLTDLLLRHLDYTETYIDDMNKQFQDLVSTLNPFFKEMK
jgi:hypothetical protein